MSYDRPTCPGRGFAPRQYECRSPYEMGYHTPSRSAALGLVLPKLKMAVLGISKRGGRQFEKFGNFHYGAVGTCAGFSAFVLHRAAGAAQFRAGTIAPEVTWIDWFIYPFGDDKNDQEMIAEGIKYANSRTW